MSADMRFAVGMTLFIVWGAFLLALLSRMVDR